MRVFIEPDLLHPERDGKLLNTMKTEPVVPSSRSLVRVETKESTKMPLAPSYSSDKGTTGTGTGFKSYSSFSYNDNKNYYKPSPSYKPLSRFVYRRIRDVIVYGWASPNQNFSYMTLSVLMEPEYSGSTTLDRIVFNLSYDKHEDIWILHSSSDKRGSWVSANDAPTFIAERWCTSEAHLISEIKGCLLSQSIDPKKVLELFLSSVNNLQVIHGDDNRVVLTKTANSKILEDKFKNKETYSYTGGYNSTSTEPKAPDTEKKFPYDDDDWDIGKWGYG